LFFLLVDTSFINLLSDISIEDLKNIKVSSVSKNDELLISTPQTVIIITQDELKNYGYSDLEQVIHNIPGFDISRGNGTEYSQIYQRGYRSNNTDRTLLLIDGVETNSLWSGSAWISRQYPLSNIERIEIIYGPASTIYGANAFLGAINIITKQNNLNDSVLRTNVSIGYGTWNTKLADVFISKNFKDISIKLSGRIFESDEMDLSNYDDFDFDLSDYDLDYYKWRLDTNKSDNLQIPDSIAILAQQLDYDSYYNDPDLQGIAPTFSNNTKDYYLAADIKIKGFSFGYHFLQINEGYGAWYRDEWELGPKHGGQWGPQNSFLYAKYDYDFSDKFSITSFTRYKIHQLPDNCEEYYYTGYMNGVLGLNQLIDSVGNILYNPELPDWEHYWYYVYSTQLRSELITNYKFSDRLNLISGFEVRNSYIQGDYVVGITNKPSEEGIAPSTAGGNHFYKREVGLYSQLSFIPLNNLKFVIGGRYDYSRIRKTGGFGSIFNPKMAIIYSFRKNIIKLIYSEAFLDAPNWAKFSTTPGRLLNNPSLEPEKVKNLELNNSIFLSNYFTTDFTLYNAYYEGALGTADVTYIDENGNLITTTQNQALGSLHIYGAQAEIKYKKNGNTAYLNYTYTNPNNTEENSNIRVGDIASHQVNIGGYITLKEKLIVSLRMNFVGEKPTGSETTISSNPYNKIDAYTILHSSITYNINKNLSLQGTINNILNTEYFHPGVRSANGEYYAARLPQNERNIQLKILYNY
jgi:outer membrane cobalamin receptor